MNIEDGVVWGCRLLLNREPENQIKIVELARGCRSPEDVRALFVNSEEFQNLYHTAGRASDTPPANIDLKEGLRWGYRLLLCREPSEAEIDYHLNNVASLSDIKSVFLFSQEFRGFQGHGVSRLVDIDVIGQFTPFDTRACAEGFFRDFLGGVTRVGYLPANHSSKSGTVESAPGTPGAGIHSTAEWVGTLRSILEARDSLVAVELGMGWAPWLVTAAIAAQRRGITQIQLVGVEGSEDHFQFAKQHFLDNGLDPDAHKLVRAVVGNFDGTARFPRLHAPSEDYGAKAYFGDAAVDNEQWVHVPSITLEKLLVDVPWVDFLHCDIQGAEAEVMTHSIGILGEKVSRIIIGTHSRQIEASLLALFNDAGWTLEHESPCYFMQQAGGDFHLLSDGEQVWRNPRPRANH